MISNKKTAKEVLKAMQQCSAALDGSVRAVMDTCAEKEFKAYRKIIGQIMGAIYCDVIRPLHRRFPGLEPKELRRR